MLIEKSFDAFTKILIQLASQYHQQPLLLKTIPWPTLIEQSRQGNPEDYQSVMKAWEMIQRYDTIILIPLSPLVMPYK